MQANANATFNFQKRKKFFREELWVLKIKKKKLPFVRFEMGKQFDFFVEPFLQNILQTVREFVGFVYRKLWFSNNVQIDIDMFQPAAASDFMDIQHFRFGFDDFLDIHFVDDSFIHQYADGHFENFQTRKKNEYRYHYRNKRIDKDGQTRLYQNQRNQNPDGYKNVASCVIGIGNKYVAT